MIRLVLVTAALALIACSDDAAPGGGGQGTGGVPASGGGPGTGGDGAADPMGGEGAGTPAGGGSEGGAGGGPSACIDVLTCDAAPPDPGAAGDWNHFSSSVSAQSFANHRGRDMFYNPGDTVWVMGKFAYGVFDDDIQDENVDVYLNRGCGDEWELVSSSVTTEDGDHATVEGVEDTGGWVFFDATSLTLEEGRHRFHFVVRGDLTTTDAYIDIVPSGTPVIVSDVDGTLTTSENEEFGALLTGSLPNPNPDSAEVLTALAEKGYRVFYLTARPQFLAGRTREFLETNGYPLGLVHTTLSFTGATGQAAADYKTEELATIAGRGLVPSWGFGNTATDAEAYVNASIQPDDQRIMFQFTDDVGQSRRIEAYSELLPEIAAASDPDCP